MIAPFPIEQRFIALERLVLAAEAKGLDEQIASYLAKLGCVQVCGNLERCIELLVVEKVGHAKAPKVTSFLRAYFKRGTNYDCDEISQLLFKFDSAWGSEFANYMTSNLEVKESIASAYAIRNSVAHGGTQSLGPRNLRQYFGASFKLVADLHAILT
jgi:hypothetical protein